LVLRLFCPTFREKCKLVANAPAFMT